MFESLAGIKQFDADLVAKTLVGQPVREHGRTVVPVARVTYGFGMGGCRKHTAAADSAPGDEGGGGGGGLSARPVAVLEIDERGMRVRPIVDVTRIVLAGLGLVAWNVFWITLTVRSLGRRGRRDGLRAAAAGRDQAQERARIG